MYNENELMEKVKKGDKHAFDEVVLRYRKQAILFAYSYVTNYDIAEDIVQDCFVKIYVLREKYKPTFSFKTYLYTLIKNRCIDYLRSNKVKDKFENSVLNRQELSAEEEYLYENRLEEIAELFERLSGDYRTALYLFAINELSYKEIAIIMGKSVSQIKITIHRARKKLQHSLEERQ